MDISLQTKQILSQVQMQSLNILAMPMMELKEFLQNEEIENPLIEYTVGGGQESELSVTYREYDRFYNSAAGDDDDEDHDLYEGEISGQTIEDMITTQLDWSKLGEKEQKIVDFCIHSLEPSGYLEISAEDIARIVDEDMTLVLQILEMLKDLEPRGIFASNLEECLTLQIEGLEHEEELRTIINVHLKDIAEGKISSISRALKLSSVDVRKRIQVIKSLNPRPLNGFGRERAPYIFPDIILGYEEGQWTISLNDKWTGSIGINEFYVHMMETAQDTELKAYFEEKLRRARFIMNAVDQRRKTLEGISAEILKRQAGYLLGKETLKPMTLEEIADNLELHKSTVSRAIRDKYILAPTGCLLIRDLFTSGIPTGKMDGEEVSRNTVKEKLKELVDKEDKKKPYSDEQLAKLLDDKGMPVSRRTVAKYRMEMGIGGTFQRKE